MNKSAISFIVAVLIGLAGLTGLDTATGNHVRDTQRDAAEVVS